LTLSLNEFPPRFPNKSIVINVNEEFLSEIFVGSLTDNVAAVQILQSKHIKQISLC
jgi:hypothetical protein